MRGSVSDSFIGWRRLDNHLRTLLVAGTVPRSGCIGQKIDRISLQSLGQHFDERMEVRRLVQGLHLAIAAIERAWWIVPSSRGGAGRVAPGDCPRSAVRR